MSKTNQQKLAAFRKANKIRRQRIAELAGFNAVEAYIAYLLDKDYIPTTTKKIIAESKPTIHIVSILDCSGSMGVTKLNNAVAGINEEVLELQRDNNVNYTFTYVSFSSHVDIQTRLFKTSIHSVGKIHEQARDMTALNQAIGETLEKFVGTPSTEKVLVKIFTDGAENNSQGRWCYASALAAFIKECETNGFTITFVGTDRDVKQVNRYLGINLSNTLVHDNSARGVKAAFNASTVATKSYSSKVIKGEDVLTGFYKKNETL